MGRFWRGHNWHIGIDPSPCVISMVTLIYVLLEEQTIRSVETWSL